MRRSVDEDLDNSTYHDDSLLFKVILIGDSGVGKSSVLLKYTTNEFMQLSSSTVGLEFASKNVEIDNETIIKLQIWDTAGQESYKSIVRSFYKHAKAVFLVYQVNRKDTFESLKSWMHEIRENSCEDIVVVLMGNQCDLVKERQVTYEEGEQFMRENGVHFFFETSALDGSNIEKAFTEAAKLLFLNFLGDADKAKLSQLNRGSKLGQYQQKSNRKRSGCC